MSSESCWAENSSTAEGPFRASCQSRRTFPAWRWTRTVIRASPPFMTSSCASSETTGFPIIHVAGWVPSTMKKNIWRVLKTDPVIARTYAESTQQSSRPFQDITSGFLPETSLSESNLMSFIWQFIKLLSLGRIKCTKGGIFGTWMTRQVSTLDSIYIMGDYFCLNEEQKNQMKKEIKLSWRLLSRRFGRFL